MPSDVSHPKLTALTTGTLTLLLERQRLQSTYPNLHLAQIVTNLRTLRSGVIALQDDNEDATLRGQYERLLDMLGSEEVAKAGLESIPDPSPPTTPLERKQSLEPAFEPYTDDPHEMDEGGIVLQQRQIMQDQDTHLDRLSSSIGRQHHISVQINDELEVHTGLLDALDTELDHTDTRMTGARRRLARVARGAKENGSTVTIAMLILVLLILIVVFKT
ncbi:hypothetical protein JVU11DRAFT_8497 [Chiua virens]|nr:hypothetical protein JVU11DRAFT_8497 [Chiua virens]